MEIRDARMTKNMQNDNHRICLRIRKLGLLGANDPREKAVKNTRWSQGGIWKLKNQQKTISWLLSENFCRNETFYSSFGCQFLVLSAEVNVFKTPSPSLNQTKPKLIRYGESKHQFYIVLFVLVGGENPLDSDGSRTNSHKGPSRTGLEYIMVHFDVFSNK